MKKPKRNESQTLFSISIDRDLLEKIKHKAAAEQRSVSGYLRFLAEQDLAMHDVPAANPVAPKPEPVDYHVKKKSSG